MKKDKDNIFYSLSLEDIQTVAIEEIGRKLAASEIKKIKDLIGERINWYDAILESINAQINLTNGKQS
jgi:hypothetical protein